MYTQIVYIGHRLYTSFQYFLFLLKMCHLFEHTWWNVWCGWVSAKFKRVASEVLEVRKRRRRWIGKMLRGGWKTFPRNVINRETTFPPPAANWQMWKYDSTFIGFQIVNKCKLLLRGWSFQCLSIKVLVSWKLWSFPTYTGHRPTKDTMCKWKTNLDSSEMCHSRVDILNDLKIVG